jgi:hypothetical protein
MTFLNKILYVFSMVSFSTVCFADDLGFRDAEKRTSPFVLRYVKQTFEELKAADAQVRQENTYIVQELCSFFSTVPRKGSYQEYRAAVLEQKFRKDVEQNHKAKAAVLYKKVKDLGLDQDLELQALVTLKQYSDGLNYTAACRSHVKAYVANMFAKDPIRQEQQKKFLKFQYDFYKVLLKKDYMSKRDCDDFRKKNQSWGAEIDMTKVSLSLLALKEAKTALTKMFTALDEKLEALLKLAKAAQDQRKDLSTKGLFTRMMGKGQMFFKTLYWKGMNKRFGSALGA